MDIALRIFRHQKYQELLQANEVNESDLTDLVCQCVECGNFVVWVAPNSESALRKRSAHFKHPHHVDSKLAVYCEKRVKSYSNAKVKNLQRTIAESRSRYIRKEFWKLMANYYSKELDFYVNEILETADPKYRQIGELFASNFRQETQDYTKGVFQIIDYVFSGTPVWIVNPYPEFDRKIMPNPRMQTHFMEQVTGKLNRKLHYLICSDVLKFIKECKSSWEICIRLFTLAVFCIFECLQKGVRIGLEGKDGDELIIYERDEQGNSKMVAMDLSFWESDKNKHILYTYAIGNVMAWIAMTPYNQTVQSNS